MLSASIQQSHLSRLMICPRPPQTSGREPWPGFFQTAALQDLLKDYCRHRAAGNDISGVIDVFKPEWLRTQEGAKRYHQLLKMRDLELHAAANKATKLRLTNQARYTPQVAATTARTSSLPKPWEFKGK